MAYARTVQSIFLVPILLFLFAVVMILTFITSTAEPVSITINGEDGREFIHPGENVHITISHLDSISTINVTGKTIENITNWDGVPGEYTVQFSAPDHEGEHTLQVSGYQEGKRRSESARFFVEAYEINIFPEDNVLVTNGHRIDTRSTPPYPNPASPSKTPVHIKFVDWKGDPRSGLLHISITRSSSGTEEEYLDDFHLEVDGRSNFMFDPAMYHHKGDPVSGKFSRNTTIYRFNAISTDYPDHPAAECGIVVHPFELELEGERTIIQGGGSSINGPYYRREPVHVEIVTSGTIGVITLTDLIDTGTHQFSISGTELEFHPENVTIYQLHVTATLEGARAETIMIIPINDWPITLESRSNALVGENYIVDVERENGEFFGARALLFNEYSIPTTAIMDIIETDSSSSPYYEKGLLDKDGRTSMTFRTPTTMMSGHYYLVVGLGSWDENSISYHGISVVKVIFNRLKIFGPQDVMINELFTISVSEINGLVVLNDMIHMYDPENQDDVEDPGGPANGNIPDNDGSDPISGTLTIDGTIRNLQNGTITLSLDRAGLHHCLVSKTGKDVTSFDIRVYNHSLFLQAPDYLITGQEFTISLWNETSPLHMDVPVHMTLEKDGNIVKTGTISHGDSSNIIGSFGNGDYLLSLVLHDHVPIVHGIQVFSHIRISFIGEPEAGSPFQLSIFDPYGRTLHGIILDVEGNQFPQNITEGIGSFVLTLESGDHEFRVLSNGFILYQGIFHVIESVENSSDLGSISIPVSLMLLIIFILYVSHTPSPAHHRMQKGISTGHRKEFK